MEAADNEALRAHILHWRRAAIRRQMKLGHLSRSVATVEKQARPINGDEPDTLGALRPTKITDVKDFLPALERWEDEIKKHEEITGAPMLQEATEKAIVTEIGAARTGNTFEAERRQIQHAYAPMKWLASHVNWKLPSQPTTMWTDHVEQGDENDQEDWNSGGQRKAKEKAR